MKVPEEIQVNIKESKRGSIPRFFCFKDRSKTTSHNLFTKTLKTLGVLKTECELRQCTALPYLIFEPTLRWL